MSRRVESRNGETHTKLQGPTGSQMGHSSRNAGKPRTWPRPLGGGWGQRYKGSQRMRKLTTVKSVELVKWKFPVKFPLSCAVCDESRTHGSNGGIGETCLMVTRPDPPHSCCVRSRATSRHVIDADMLSRLQEHPSVVVHDGGLLIIERRVPFRFRGLVTKVVLRKHTNIQQAAWRVLE